MSRISVVPLVALLMLSGMAAAQCDTGLTTPVSNAPYSGLRRVITVKRKTDGVSSRSEGTESVARDSKGRTYEAGERRWTTVVGGERIEKSEILVRIFDPVGNTDTTWTSGDKKVKVVHFAPDPSKKHELLTNPFSFDALAQNQGASKLGTKTIEGLSAEGTRYTDGKGFSHECWYSPALKIAILQTGDDPNYSFTDRLESIVRGEPDVRKYLPPSEYSVQHVYMPQLDTSTER